MIPNCVPRFRKSQCRFASSETMDPVEFLRLARALKAQPIEPNEACNRAIVSRAYYGAFLAARAAAEAKSFSSGPDVHKKLQDWFIANKQSAIGNRLKDCHHLRIRADYKTNEVVSSGDRDSALRFSERILRDLGVNP